MLDLVFLVFVINLVIIVLINVKLLLIFNFFKK